MSNNTSAAWTALDAHAKKDAAHNLPTLFQNDPHRFASLNVSIPGLQIDYSRQRMNAETLSLLHTLLKACDFSELRAGLFSGEKINKSENRAVLHTALRSPVNANIVVDGQNIIPGIHQTLARMNKFCDTLHAGEWRGHTGQPIDTIINIGIGGSDLGPRMVVDSLAAFQRSSITTYFVSNVDGHDLWQVLGRCNPETTLLVIASKTFTTAETMMNAHSARKWLIEKLGSADAVLRHAVAVSSNMDETKKFGIPAEQVFSFGEWVGGRFSVWSSIGLSVALSIGFENFRAFLDGAHALDQHFLSAPDLENIPVILALLDIWNRNFIKTSAIATLPYDQRMRLFPAWLQQTIMESNGKCVSITGDFLDKSTSPIIFGTPGTDCQHSYMQMIHQGTDIIPCDFIGVLDYDHPWPDHHKMVLANMVAQADALMHGRSVIDSNNDPQRSFPGNRPSTIFLLDRIDPWHMGLLMAAQEHRVFVQGVLWGINSFDQFGVELGKIMANQSLNTISSSNPCPPGLLGRIATHFNRRDS